MDTHPDQEVVKASEPGGDPMTQNECPTRGLPKECNDQVRRQEKDPGLVDKLISASASESTNLDNADESVVELDKYPEPYFLRKVLLTEWKENEGDDFRLLAVTVHAVMLESGFHRIHPSGPFPNEPFAAVSLLYSLPEILTVGSDETFQGVALKLQSLGGFLIVYGSLTPLTSTSTSTSVVRRLCLNMTAFGPKIRLMMNFFHENGITSASSTPATCSYPEQVVFVLWKTLKEDLVLPLMIDLSNDAGLRVPSSFLTLRVELQLNIMGCLNGVELVKLGCVCSNFHQLSSNGDLWKKMYKDEFIELPLDHGTVTDWKQTFARSWRRMRRRKRMRRDVLYGSLQFSSLCRSYIR